MASQQTSLLHKEIYAIRYKRFPWVKSVSREMILGLRDTEAAYRDWLSRARLQYLSLARDGFVEAAEEIQELLNEHSDFNPAIFQTRILSEDYNMEFQLSSQRITQLDPEESGLGKLDPKDSDLADADLEEPFSEEPDSAPPGPARKRVPARASGHTEENAGGLFALADLLLVPGVEIRDASNQKLWITSASWGCFCLTCPCPPMAAPSVHTDATHCLVPRHFHTDPLQHDHARVHFETVHNEKFPDNDSLIRRHGRLVRLGTSVLLRDQVSVDMHNRAVTSWYSRVSRVRWSELQAQPCDGEPTDGTILASTLPATMLSIAWPEPEDSRWAIICPFPTCTMPLDTSRAHHRSKITRHFQQHNIHIQDMFHAIQLFGYKLVGDSPQPDATTKRLPPSGLTLVSNRRSEPVTTGPRRSQGPPNVGENKISGRRLRPRSDTSTFHLTYRLGGAWVGRGHMWALGEEKLYQEFDKRNPFSPDEAKHIVEFDKLDKLRQKCRDAGVNMSPRWNTKQLQSALKQSALMRSGADEDVLEEVVEAITE